jgi:hypothetical protein
MTLRTAKPESKKIVPPGEERWGDWLFQDKCVLRKINLRMLFCNYEVLLERNW